MFCLAAQRKPDGKLYVISPEHGFEFDMDESIFNSVKVGQFSRIEIENNVPKTVIKEDGIEGLEVRVEEDLALVSGVIGKLINTCAYFYETKEFGNVACRDEQPKDAGTEHNIIVSRLPEEGRVGMYSKCVWGAVSDGLVEVDDKLKNRNLEVVGTDTSSRDVSVACDRELKEGTSTSEALEEVPLKTVSGFICNLDRLKIHGFMACSLSFPRVDIKIRLSTDYPLEIGDFVEVKVTPEQYEKHFPSKPDQRTPRLFTKSYRKIDKPSQYSIKAHKTNVWVTIREVKLPSDYKKGGNIYDPYIGVISDKLCRIPAGSSVVDINISRHNNAFTANGGEMTSWLVTDANAMSNTSSKPLGRLQKLLEPKVTETKETKQDDESAEKAESEEPVPPKINRLLNLKHNPALPASKRKDKVQGVGFNKKTFDENDLVSKVAVVTSVKTNPKFKRTVAYLWLLDDVTKSIFYLPPHLKLDVGHFFQGCFIKNGDEWECKQYNRPVSSFLDADSRDNYLYFRIRVHDYFPETIERMMPETYNTFLGRIVDKYRILPQDCSGGVNISVRLCKIEAKKEWCWVVTRVFQSKYIQLLSEFYNAWHAAGISDKISRKCPTHFDSLNDAFSVQLGSRITRLRPGKSNVKIANESEEWDENKTYAWVTEIGEDFVRMIVFPRRERKTINSLKVDMTNISQRSSGITARRLYEVRQEKEEVIELIDCPQYISADENDHFEFEFYSTGNDRLSKNIAIVEPVGMPKWLGKLMFLIPDHSIPKRTTFWKSRFRLLDNKNWFVDSDVASANGVCFINVGEVEKLTKSELSKDSENIPKELEPIKDENLELFKNKMRNHSRDDIYSLYNQVRYVLRNEEIVEELKKQNVYTAGMQVLQRN